MIDIPDIDIKLRIIGVYIVKIGDKIHLSANIVRTLMNTL